MDKHTPHPSFGKWFSQINHELLSKQVETLKQDYYTKKLANKHDRGQLEVLVERGSDVCI